MKKFQVSNAILLSSSSPFSSSLRKTFIHLVSKSLEESRALQFNIRETNRATKTSGHLRGRWYVTKHDRNILRKCGWIIGTIVKHRHWDIEDDVRVGGTVLNHALTHEEVTLRGKIHLVISMSIEQAI